MRDLFPGYYIPTEEEISQLWENSIFVFDTNMLLNIYHYQPESQESFFEVLTKLNDRIWIPHQAALEYQRRRLTVIADQINAYDEVMRVLDEASSGLSKRLKIYKERHSFIDPTQILSPIITAINEAKSIMRNAKKEHPNLKQSDPLRTKIDELFKGKIGKNYTDVELEEKYREAEKRIEWKIPPGYEDEGKRGTKKYGDIILWFQLIEYASYQKKPIIFITDDTKEDWWLLHRDRPNQEHPQPIGPRPELVDEMLAKAAVPFNMYQGYQFVTKARRYLDLKYQRDVIEDIRDIGRQSDSAAARRERILSNLEKSRVIMQNLQDSSISSAGDKDLLATLAAKLYGHGFFSPLLTTNIINSSIESDNITSDEEKSHSEFSCDRCGNPMSEKAYEMRSICNDCWDDMTYEKEE